MKVFVCDFNCFDSFLHSNSFQNADDRWGMKKGGKGTCGGEDGKGGKGGGGVVGLPRQSIGLAIAGTLAIDDVVGVGSEGGGPSSMPSGCCRGL